MDKKLLGEILSQQVKQLLTDSLEPFLISLTTKYSISRSELDMLLIECFPKKNIFAEKININEDNNLKKKEEFKVDKAKITNSKTTKTELMNICSSLKISKTGNKEELVKRILNILDSEESNLKVETPKNVLEQEENVVVGFVNCSEKVKEIPKRSSISEYINKQTKAIEINRNKFGKYEHKESRLVFNEDKIVVGVQQLDGSVEKLTDADIETCKKYTFAYKLPSNLNTKVSSEDYKVEELEESDLEEEEEEPEEIEDDE